MKRVARCGAGWMAGVVCMGLVVSGSLRSHGGEMNLVGDLVVRSNQLVLGQFRGDGVTASNVTVTGTATLWSASITILLPQGDLSMGPFTNRPAGGN